VVRGGVSGDVRTARDSVTVVKTKKVRTRKLAKARRPGYRHARNSSGGCGGGGVRAKSHGAANRKQDGNASGVYFGAFSVA